MIGVHISQSDALMRAKGKAPIHEAIYLEREAFAAAGAPLAAVQIFTHGPYGYNKIKFDDEKLIYEVERKSGESAVELVIHSAYVAVVIWQYASAPDSKKKTIYHHIKSQMDVSDQLGSRGVVVHLPRKPLAVVMAALDHKDITGLITEHKSQLILEIVPHVSAGSFALVENLNELLKYISKFKGKVSVCIDTAHMWGSGIESGDHDVVKKYFDAIEIPALVSVIHLNGSTRKTFNRGRDVHEIPMGARDEMFAHRDKSSLPIIIEFAQKYKCAVICEISRGCDDEETCAPIKLF